jgi:glutathione S-transferase
VQRARCNQLISIADNYAYPQMVWGVYVERVSKPKKGTPTDERKLASAARSAASCLGAMAQLMGAGPWLVGDHVTLADLYAAAMFHYFMMAPEAEGLIDPFHNLKRWWSRVSCRPSMIKTRPA